MNAVISSVVFTSPILWLFRGLFTDQLVTFCFGFFVVIFLQIDVRFRSLVQQPICPEMRFSQLRNLG